MTGQIFSDGFEDGTTNAWSMTSHTNGIHDVHWMDGSYMQRPARIRARRAGTFPWDPGAYQFDGAGNVTAIGAQTFTYDEGNRLAQSQADDGFGVVTQTYGYDGFGNLVSITDPQGTRTFEADLATNRLAAAAYDAAGNLTSWGGFSYEWRPTGELRTRTGTGLNKWFAYDAGGERVVVHDRLSGRMTFTIRDLGGTVLRVFGKDAGGSWSWEKDYVYRNGLLLASKDPAGTVHFTLDHLGTPRYVTDAAGNEVARHSYFGFGEEATSTWQDEAMKITGHERDLEGTPNRLDDLDYMHARYYNPLIGRFLSVDPIGGSIGASQNFNRYAYVGNSPLNYVDPFGLAKLYMDMNGDYYLSDLEIVVTATPLPPARQSTNGWRWIRRKLAGNSVNSRQTFGSAMSDWIMENISVPGPYGTPQSTHASSLRNPATWNDIGEDLTGGWDFAFKASYGTAGVSVGAAIAVGSGPAALTASRTLALRLFGKNGWLNSGRHLRVGFGRHGGQKVFRIAGELVSKHWGRPKIDIWKGGPL